MNRTPERGLYPPEEPRPPLRCSLCLRAVPEALDLYGRTICHPCLQTQNLDDLSALLCAAIITEDEGGTL